MVARYYRELLNFLSRSVKDRDTAADLVQESYARILAAQKNGENIRDPRALLYRTARNLVIDQHRHDAVRQEVNIDLAENEETDALEECAGSPVFQPDILLASQQGVDAMLLTIERLPPRCREIFILHKFDGLPYADIARQMGISPRTVEMQLQIAMDACWHCLETLHAGDSIYARRGKERKKK